MSIAFSYRRCSRFFYRRRNLTPLLNILAVDIKPHKILFRDVKNINSSRQIEFTRVSLVILGNKIMDCTYDIDHTLSRKRKKLEQKKNSYWQFLLLVVVVVLFNTK